MLMSQEYLEQLQQKHATKPWGGSGHSWVQHIVSLIGEEVLELSILDYGCGRGTFKPAMKEAMPGAQIAEYDPGIPGKDRPPLPADLVVCTDVLEHVEPEFVDMTLCYLAELTKWRCFMVIACDPSKSLLPDGRNAHLTIEPPEWWHGKVKLFFGKEFEIRVYERKRGRTIICATKK